MKARGKHTIEVLKDRGIVRVTVRGAIDLVYAKAISAEAIGLAADSGHKRFLYDLREAALEMNVTDLYALPREFPASAGHRVAALVTKDDDLSRWEFLETVEQNIGINTKICTRLEDAYKWLQGT